MLSALYVLIVLNISFSNLLLLPLWNPALSTLSLKLEDLHCTWPFWNMSEPSFVCYSSCCNCMFVWIFLQGCKSPMYSSGPAENSGAQYGPLFSPPETRGSLGRLHRSITLSCAFILGWNEIGQREKWLVRRERHTHGCDCGPANCPGSPEFSL